MQRLSLINFSVSLSLIDVERGKMVWNVRSSSALRRIQDIFSSSLNIFDWRLVSQETLDQRLRVDGAVSAQSSLKPVYELFVNNRPISSSNGILLSLTDRSKRHSPCCFMIDL